MQEATKESKEFDTVIRIDPQSNSQNKTKRHGKVLQNKCRYYGTICNPCRCLDRGVWQELCKM